jgi:hypothetical protein
MKASDRMLVLLVGLFNSPSGRQAWLKCYFPMNTPLNEALDWARTRVVGGRRADCGMEWSKCGARRLREVDPYADSIIASGDYAFYSEV